jgi:hypothetical protein
MAAAEKGAARGCKKKRWLAPNTALTAQEMSMIE